MNQISNYNKTINHFKNYYDIKTEIELASGNIFNMGK